MEAQVPMPYRRSMGHHNVSPLWYQVPFLQTFLATWQVEGPVTELGLPEEGGREGMRCEIRGGEEEGGGAGEEI